MYDFGVRLADVNGDGLPDLLFASADAPDRTWRGVFLNNGQNGWVFDEQWSAALQAPWLPADYFFTMRINTIGNIWISTDSGLRLMDINGDGLADLVFARNGRREVCLNNGRGWNAPGGWAFPVDLVQTRGTEVGDNMVNVVDLDADGYPDIVYYIENRGVAVYLNNRVGGFTNVTGTLSLPEPLGMVRAGWTGPGANDAGTRIFDVNGDGVPDFVRGFRWTDNTTRNSIWLISSQSAPSRKIPNLLTRHVNPLGGRTTITYGTEDGRHSGAGLFPFVQTVVTSVVREAGLFGDSVERTDYDYGAGIFAPPTGGGRGQEFRGFSAIWEKRGVDSQTGAYDTERYREFHTDEGRKGLVLKEELSGSDSEPYAEQKRQYSSTLGEHDVYLVQLQSETQRTYHQDRPGEFVERTTSYTYGDYGNLTAIREHDWSPTPGTPGAVLRSTATTYAPNDAAYIVGLPSTVARYEGDMATRLSLEMFCYDRPPHAGCGNPPLKGAVTTRKLGDFRLQGKPLASGSWITVTTFEYDAYGNQTVERNGRDLATRTTWIGKDDENGYLFPYRVTRDNPGGKPILRTTVYDQALGVLTQVTGLNGEITRYTYDGLGRLRTVRRPGDTDDAVSVSYRLSGCNGSSDPIPCSIAQERLDGGRTRTTHEYVDLFGRPKANVTGGAGAYIVSGLTTYDRRGRPSEIVEPFSCSGPWITQCPGGAARTTTYTYEDDKLATTTHPDGSRTSNYYLADGVKQTDEHGIVTHRTYDVFEQLVEIESDSGGPSATNVKTTYAYDGLGGLSRSIADAGAGQRNLSTTYFYDARGLLRVSLRPTAARRSTPPG